MCGFRPLLTVLPPFSKSFRLPVGLIFPLLDVKARQRVFGTKLIGQRWQIKPTKHVNRYRTLSIPEDEGREKLTRRLRIEQVSDRLGLFFALARHEIRRVIKDDRLFREWFVGTERELFIYETAVAPRFRDPVGGCVDSGRSLDQKEAKLMIRLPCPARLWDNDRMVQEIFERRAPFQPEQLWRPRSR
jgi:hypothetical protein